MLKNKLILVCIGMLILSACGKQEINADKYEVPAIIDKTSYETVSPNVSEETTSDSIPVEVLGEINVDKNLFSVELNIPAEFVGETTQEELNETAKVAGFKSITLNEDGSATYIMTKEQHKILMEEVAQNLNNTLAQMCGSEDYPNITNIEANNDFTKFTVTTKNAEIDLAESFSVLGFYMYGGYYNVFNGKQVDNIQVVFVNADTGAVISEANSSDAE